MQTMSEVGLPSLVQILRNPSQFARPPNVDRHITM